MEHVAASLAGTAGGGGASGGGGGGMGGSGASVETLIADSDSRDDTPAVATKAFPGSGFLSCGNIGFGAAANRAIAAARAPWILLCNPDLTFPTDFGQRLLGPLFAHLSRDAAPPKWLAARAGCVAPRLVNADGSPQASVGRFPTIGRIVRDQFRPRERRKYSFPQPALTWGDGQGGPIAWASGACLLIHRARCLSVGGFDENYFLYVEEVDLQRRLYNAGHPTWFFPGATVMHHQPNAGRPARPLVQCWSARGTLRYFAKFGGVGSLFAYRMIAFAGGRLSATEAFARREKILERSTGP